MSEIACNVTPRKTFVSDANDVYEVTPDDLNLAAKPIVTLDSDVIIRSIDISGESGTSEPRSIIVQVTLDSVAVTGFFKLSVWLSDSATDPSPTDTKPDGNEQTEWVLVTNSSGRVVLSINHTGGADSWYMWVDLGGELYVSDEIAFV